MMSWRSLLGFILLPVCTILAHTGQSASNEMISDHFRLLQIHNFGFEFFNRFGNVSAISSLRDTNKSSVTDGFQMYNDGAAENECLSQIKLVTSGIRRNELWAMKYFDSWGKMPSGILYGHLMEMGNFDECMESTHSLASNDNQKVQGKYCMTNFPLGALMNSSSAINSTLKLQIGICIPTACQAKQIDALLKKMLDLNDEMLTIEFVKESSCQSKEEIHLEAIDWVAIGILILIAIALIGSTAYDYVKTHEKLPLNPLYSSFSIRANLNQLLRVSSKRNAPHAIPCLNGIRCLSIIWIVFGHCYMMLLLSPNMNSIDIIAWTQSAFSMFLQSATISVDSFFFLSGLLLVTISFRQMQKTSGKINVPLMYLHRYLRLTPVLALAVLLFVSLYRYPCKGPLCASYTSSWKLCEETWWTTLLYVQNYAAAGKMCLGHSWYLAVDMQLYLVSPLILISLWKWKLRGLAGLLLIGALLFVCLFSTVVMNQYEIGNITNNLGGNAEEMRAIYYSTHTRSSPWIIGIAFGYYLHTRDSKCATLTKVVVAFGWLSALAIFFTVIFVLYPNNQSGARSLTPVEGAFYLSFSRIAWPVALAWIVFACVNGYGGPINQFLSWSFWEPLSRLSYCIYIWHLLVQSINAGRIKTNPYFSDYDVILRFWGDFGITLFVALLMYLAIEAPMVGIEKFLFTRNKSETKDILETTMRPNAAVSQITLVE